MESFEHILLMLAAISLSYLINRFMPRLSIPIIQIALGVGISLLPLEHSIELDPELFLVLFIAPLLFNDGRHTDKKTLWELKKPILLMALGLVFATVFVLGYSLHALIPVIPLAAAFALAAALAPTDAIAVGALKERVKIPSRIMHILEGESLINDASGLVSFQFAVVAMMTGAFSLASASLGFLLISLGGIVLGLALTLVKSILVRWIRRLGMEDVTLHMLIEVLTPFLIFMAAEELGVNGVLAVVASGIAHSFSFRRLDPELAKLRVVSQNTWSVIIFTLNGLVFLLLGTQLLNISRDIWISGDITHTRLILYILLITLFLLGLRFLWVMIAVNPSIQREEDTPARKWREGLILSFGGVRGTITLASTLSLPLLLADGSAFPARDLMIFLAAGVILTTLLLTNFLLPVLIGEDNDTKRDAEEKGVKIEILRKVIAGLHEQATDDNKLALQVVIHAYVNRIQSLDKQDMGDEKQRKWWIACLEWERERTLQAIENQEMDLLSLLRYLYRLDRRLHLYTKDIRYRSNKLPIKNLGHLLRKGQNSPDVRKQRKARIDAFHAKNCQFVLRKLEEALAEAPTETEAINPLILRYQNVFARVSASNSFSSPQAFEQEFDELARIGIQLERDYTHAAFENGQISRAAMTELRRAISLMEQDLKVEAL